MINDATKSEILRLVDELHHGEYGPSINEYRRYADLSTGATNAYTLVGGTKRVSWGEILKMAGAPPAKFHAVRSKSELDAPGRYKFYWELT